MAEGLDPDMAAIADEIEGMVISGEVLALAAVVVTRNGEVTLKSRYIPGGSLSLVAGIDLLHRNILDSIRELTRPIRKD